MSLTIQRIAVAGTTAALSLGMAIGAVAASPQSTTPDRGMIAIGARGNVELRGTVTNADATARVLRVKVWGMEWSVRVTNDTTIRASGNGTIALSDVAVGHVIQVHGQADASTPMVVTAKKIMDRSSPKVRFTFVGRVTALTPPDALTFQREGGGQLTVKVASSTTFREGNAVKTYGDLSVGTRIAIAGTYDANTNTFTATEVRIGPVEAVRELGAQLLPKLRGRMHASAGLGLGLGLGDDRRE
ncbi:hypothetical protein HYV74_01930 [Candidatus Uhrbacteria bacterium]|nr:hypothetical protein [Candidatus Uhrbacteria bacterium]